MANWDNGSRGNGNASLFHALRRWATLYSAEIWLVLISLVIVLLFLVFSVVTHP